MKKINKQKIKQTTSQPRFGCDSDFPWTLVTDGRMYVWYEEYVQYQEGITLLPLNCLKTVVGIRDIAKLPFLTIPDACDVAGALRRCYMKQTSSETVTGASASQQSRRALHLYPAITIENSPTCYIPSIKHTPAQADISEDS